MASLRMQVDLVENSSQRKEIFSTGISAVVDPSSFSSEIKKNKQQITRNGKQVQIEMLSNVNLHLSMLIFI